MNSSITRIRSGGQTGVDRGALDAALELGIGCGGWCPKGRLAEDGEIPMHYPLQETPLAKYGQRTEWNVRDSDATLILIRDVLEGGSAFTQTCAQRLGKPSTVASLGDTVALDAVAQWLEQSGFEQLNVAGPRESKCPGIARQAQEFLVRLLQD